MVGGGGSCSSVGGAGGGERSADRPRTSPSQRLMSTHHHHHHLGYSLLPAQYNLPYAAGKPRLPTAIQEHCHSRGPGKKPLLLFLPLSLQSVQNPSLLQTISIIITFTSSLGAQGFSNSSRKLTLIFRRIRSRCSHSQRVTSN